MGASRQSVLETNPKGGELRARQPTEKITIAASPLVLGDLRRVTGEMTGKGGKPAIRGEVLEIQCKTVIILYHKLQRYQETKS